MTGAKSDGQQKGSPADEQQKSKSKTGDGSGKPGGTSVSDGAGDRNAETGEAPPPQDAASAADEANLEYARKATEMVLNRLKDEEHNPDPELLKKLGWSREDMAEFLRRWESLKQSAETPGGKRELDETLKSLGLRDPKLRKQAAGKTTDNQRDLRDGGNRTAPPPKYRELFDAFRKGAARSGP